MPYRLPLVAASFDAIAPAVQFAEGWLLAFNADAAAAGIGLISLAIGGAILRVSPSIAKLINDCGPPLVELIGKWRKMINDTAPQVARNTEELAALRKLWEETHEQNDLLRRNLGRAINEINGMRQESSDLSEAGLINKGVWADPIKTGEGSETE